MLITILPIVLFVLFVILTKLFDEYDHDILSVFSCILAATACIAMVITGFTTIVANIDVAADVAKCEQRQAALEYQVENFDFLYGSSVAEDRKLLMDDIREWNEDLAAYRKHHDSPWLNWQYPIDYNQFDFIEFPE